MKLCQNGRGEPRNRMTVRVKASLKFLVHANTDKIAPGGPTTSAIIILPTI